MTSSISALSAYRQILRASRIAFQDDYTLISAARAEARKGFESHRKPSVDTPMNIHHAVEVASLLRHNIVQGVQEDDRWRLRIHDDIERGDNDSVKIEGKNVKVDKPCSS